MKSLPLTPDTVPVIVAAIEARRPVTLEMKGRPVATVQPILTVTKEEAARILREIAEADRGDDWETYTSW